MTVLVVGLGNMGTRHARVLGDLGHDVVTVDPVAPAADYRALEPVAAEFEIEAACVAVPIPALAGVATDVIAQLAPSRVLVEKPGAANVQALAGLARTAQRAGTRLFIGYTERHNPAALALHARLAAGGSPVAHVVATRFSPDAPISPAVPHEIDLAVHDLDLAHGFGVGPSLVSWFGGYSPVRTRASACIHEDGSATVLDLDHRLVNGEPVDGEEPLRREWREVMAAPAGYVPIYREIAVLADAERRVDVREGQVAA